MREKAMDSLPLDCLCYVFQLVGSVQHIEGVVKLTSRSFCNSVKRCMSEEEHAIQVVKHDLMKHQLLSTAAEFGKHTRVSILIKAGADIHTGVDLPLRLAAQNGHEHVCKLLLEAGAHAQAQANYPIRVSARNGHIGIVAQLLARGVPAHAVKSSDDMITLRRCYPQVGQLLDITSDSQEDVNGALLVAAVSSSDVQKLEEILQLGNISLAHIQLSFCLAYSRGWWSLHAVQRLQYLIETETEKGGVVNVTYHV